VILILVYDQHGFNYILIGHPLTEEDRRSGLFITYGDLDLSPCFKDVYVRRVMVVRVEAKFKTVLAINRGHSLTITYLLGYGLNASYKPHLDCIGYRDLCMIVAVPKATREASFDGIKVDQQGNLYVSELVDCGFCLPKVNTWAPSLVLSIRITWPGVMQMEKRFI
jgi:hypothetical protein